MNRTLVSFALALLLAAAPAAAQKVYKWVDKDGNVHFGDSVPPEYADQVFGKGEENGQGAAPSAESSAAVQAELARREEARRQQEADQNLLRTYVSVDEIESVRDRRIEQRQGQDRLTRRYIESLERELAVLEAEAERHRAGSGGQLPPDLAARIADIRTQIDLYQQELRRSEAEQQEIRDRFAKDITRFRELKGLPAGDDAG